jgi:arylsulfatase A-like enzyme
MPERVVLVILAVLVAFTGAESAQAALPRPNIILVLTDDMSTWDLAHMPTVESQLVARGVTFSNSFVLNPLCCPSRATILTGRTSGSTDIWDNTPPNGGFATFLDRGEESSTIATWLHKAGYQTSLDGKYLNGYKPSDYTHIPPGWDDWHALALGTNGVDSEGAGGYFDYYTADNGRLQYHGSAEADYSTTVLGNDAVHFIDKADPSRPVFLYLATRAPHGPATPDPKYAGACSEQAPRDPAFNETNVTDKPAYIQALPRLTATQISAVDALATNRCETLLSVDDQVRRIIAALKSTARLSNTLIVFASDNGFSLGDHRWRGKIVPYDASIRVPLVLRYDPITRPYAGTANTDLALNLDYAPTFAAAARVRAVGATGRNLLDAITGASWRNGFLIEHQGEQSTNPLHNVPAYCGIRTKRRLYVQYATGEQELYDLQRDPHELSNLTTDPAYAQQLVALHDRTMDDCIPRPPGWPASIT